MQEVPENRGHGAQFPVVQLTPSPPAVQENYNGQFGHDQDAQPSVVQLPGPGTFLGVRPNPVPPQAINVPLANVLSNLTILHLINPNMNVVVFDNVVPGHGGVLHMWMAIPLNTNL